MPIAVIQRGHVPRRTGSTGTAGEQETVIAIAAEYQRQRPPGWEVRIIDADVSQDLYRGDVFIALHCDGGAPSSSGASVGYKTAEGNALAQRWKAAYIANGWPNGFKNDNYTSNLSGYYGFTKCLAVGNRACMVAEHGFLTNSSDAAWIRANIAKCAETGWEAITGVTGGVDMPVLEQAPAGWQRFWRLRNSKGDYLFTASANEANSAVSGGYVYEGSAWDVSLTDQTNTYTLYRLAKDGWHHYALEQEARALRNSGWVMEGPVAKVSAQNGTPVYRMVKGGAHLFTTSYNEVQSAERGGFTYEGVAWYNGLAVSQTEPPPTQETKWEILDQDADTIVMGKVVV